MRGRVEGMKVMGQGDWMMGRDEENGRGEGTRTMHEGADEERNDGKG